MKADCRDDWKDSDPDVFHPLTDGAHRPCSSTWSWELPTERGWVTEWWRMSLLPYIQTGTMGLSMYPYGRYWPTERGLSLRLEKSSNQVLGFFLDTLSWGHHEKSLGLRRGQRPALPCCYSAYLKAQRELPNTGWNSYCPSVSFCSAEVSWMKIRFFLPQAEILNQRLGKMFLLHWQRFKADSKGSGVEMEGVEVVKFSASSFKKCLSEPNSYIF